MFRELDAAFDGGSWSLIRIVHSIGAVRDGDGRPLGEGRAPAEVRDAVPMVKRRCPYRDERYQRWMNVSALAQMTANLDDALDQIRAVRSHLARPPVWEDVYATLMSQMAGPAMHVLLAGRDYDAPPALSAVGYKVAAGYTTPVREVMVDEARGAEVELSLAALNQRLRSRRHLVGAREVCAAPDPMLDRVTGTFLCEPAERPDPAVDPRLLTVARLLAQQAQIGICWELYDTAMEHRLLVDDVGRSRMQPRTQYVGRIVDERLESMTDPAPSLADIRVTPTLAPADRSALVDAMTWQSGDQPWQERTRSLVRAAALCGEAALQLPDELAGGVVAERFAAYISAYCTFARVAIDLERRIRGQLDRDDGAPVALIGILPLPRCLRWLELMVGHRLRMEGPPDGEVLLRSQHQTYRLPTALWQA